MNKKGVGPGIVALVLVILFLAEMILFGNFFQRVTTEERQVAESAYIYEGNVLETWVRSYISAIKLSTLQAIYDIKDQTIDRSYTCDYSWYNDPKTLYYWQNGRQACVPPIDSVLTPISDRMLGYAKEYLQAYRDWNTANNVGLILPDDITLWNYNVLSNSGFENGPICTDFTVDGWIITNSSDWIPYIGAPKVDVEALTGPGNCVPDGWTCEDYLKGLATGNCLIAWANWQSPPGAWQEIYQVYSSPREIESFELCYTRRTGQWDYDYRLRFQYEINGDRYDVEDVNDINVFAQKVCSGIITPTVATKEIKVVIRIERVGSGKGWGWLDIDDVNLSVKMKTPCVYNELLNEIDCSLVPISFGKSSQNIEISRIFTPSATVDTKVPKIYEIARNNFTCASLYEKCDPVGTKIRENYTDETATKKALCEGKSGCKYDVTTNTCNCPSNIKYEVSIKDNCTTSNVRSVVNDMITRVSAEYNTTYSNYGIKNTLTPTQIIACPGTTIEAGEGSCYKDEDINCCRVSVKLTAHFFDISQSYPVYDGNTVIDDYLGLKFNVRTGNDMGDENYLPCKSVANQLCNCPTGSPLKFEIVSSYIDGKIYPQRPVTLKAFGPKNCNNRVVYFYSDSCNHVRSDPNMASCNLSSPDDPDACSGQEIEGSCIVRVNIPWDGSSLPKTYTYWACLDKNNDGDFADEEESANYTFTVSNPPETNYAWKIPSVCYANSDFLADGMCTALNPPYGENSESTSNSPSECKLIRGVTWQLQLILETLEPTCFGKQSDSIYYGIYQEWFIVPYQCCRMRHYLWGAENEVSSAVIKRWWSCGRYCIVVRRSSYIWENLEDYSNAIECYYKDSFSGNYGSKKEAPGLLDESGDIYNEMRQAWCGDKDTKCLLCSYTSDEDKYRTNATWHVCKGKPVPETFERIDASGKGVFESGVKVANTGDTVEVEGTTYKCTPWGDWCVWDSSQNKCT